MSSHTSSGNLDRLAATVLRVSARSELSDLELLGRFASDRDEAAFTVLVRRHGRLVAGVCRRVLHDSHHAEDVVQATFLLLAQKAGVLVRRGVVVPGWLYLAARRIATRARRGDDRRRVREKAAAPPRPDSEPDDVLIWEEVKRAVDDEVAGLPAKYREAVVLCYFAGLTQDQIAAQLRVPRTTAQFRLEKGRSLLEQRLVRRGLALSAAVTTVLAAPGDAPAAVPLARAAVAWVKGDATIGVTAAAQALARDGAAGLATRAWAVMLGGLVLAAVGGMGWLFPAPQLPPEAAVAAAVPLPIAPAPRAVEQNREPVVVTGRVSDPSGAAVPHAEVAVLAADPVSARQPLAHARELARGRAGGDGRFRIELPRAVPGGSLSLVARADNHALGTASVPARPPADTAVTLPPVGAPVRVRVIGPDGRPAAGVRVAATQIGAVRAEVAGREPPPFWPAAAVSGPDGRAELAGVRPLDGLTVTVRDDRYEPAVVALLGGADGEQEVRLKPARTCEVTVASAGSGRPVAGVRLVLVPLAAGTDDPIAGLAAIGESGADGVCRLAPVGAGRYRLTALPPPGSPYLATRVARDWPADDPAKHVERLAIPPAVVVRGRVTGPDGGPVPGAIVHAIPAGERDPASPGMMTGADGAVRTGADGAFALAVPPGDAAVLVHGPGEDYVSRPVAGAAGSGVRRYAHAAARVRLTVGEEPAAQDFRLAAGERVPVKVELADGSPAAQAVLVCRSRALAATPEVLKRYVVADGRVELPGCDPDRDYPVLVWDLQKRQGAAAVVPGRRTDAPVTIRLAPLGAAGVRGVDAAGQPAGFAPTRLAFTLPPDVPRGSKGDPFAGEPDPDNEFDARSFDLRPIAPRGPGDRPGEVGLNGLVPGATYRVALQAQDGWRRSEGFRVRSGESRRGPDVVVRP
ncbi:sigma-70 family RNA polymerase sigma factor [Gemmata sp.]|uniref:sigma-70 family RNA polymerase sigma factor n=1 Tax=Gemmata sp. TaxID=1914242 RepID=UPI003F714D28